LLTILTSAPGATVTGFPNAMFSMVIVAAAVAVGLFMLVDDSLEVAVAVFVGSVLLLVPPHPLTRAATRPIAATNTPIFFILTPNF
jgi:hypothetical protein